MTQPPDIQSVDQVRYGRWRRFRNSTVALAEREEMAEEFERVIDLGYLDGTSPAPETSGVTIYDEERACKGWNFYTSGHAAEAHLMNMEGEVVHTWAYKYEDVWPARIPSWERGTHHWRRGHLFDNGDLLCPQMPPFPCVGIQPAYDYPRVCKPEPMDQIPVQYAYYLFKGFGCYGIAHLAQG